MVSEPKCYDSFSVGALLFGCCLCLLFYWNSSGGDLYDGREYSSIENDNTTVSESLEFLERRIAKLDESFEWIQEDTATEFGLFTPPELYWNLESFKFEKMEAPVVDKLVVPDLKVIECKHLPYRLQICGFVANGDLSDEKVILVVKDCFENEVFHVKARDKGFFAERGCALQKISVRKAANARGGVEHVVIVELLNDTGEEVTLKSGELSLGMDFVVKVKFAEQVFVFGSDSNEMSTDFYRLEFDLESVLPELKFLITNLSTSESSLIRKIVSPPF